MKKFVIIAALLLSSCAAQKEQQSKVDVSTQDRIIVTYSDGSKSEILNAAQQKGMNIVYDLKNMNIIVLGVKQQSSEGDIEELRHMKGVLAVERDSNQATIQ